MVYLTAAQKPKSGLGCLIVEVARSHTIINPHTALRNPWKGDQLVAESATYTAQNKLKRQASVYSAAFEPLIPETKRLQTDTLDRMATDFGLKIY
jgi:hypothetical protein